MVRRRTMSPRPSAPIRSSPPPASHQRATPAPTPTAAPPPGMAPRQGSGLMGQMAATAGGVAIGSAVGHSIGRMFDGGSGGQPAEAQQQAAAQTDAYGQQQSAYGNQYARTPCEQEWSQFLECSQNQQDLNLCQAYSDLFKQCKARYTP